MYTKQQEFWHDDVCLDLVSGDPDTKVKVYGCHGMKGNQKWSHVRVRGIIQWSILGSVAGP